MKKLLLSVLALTLLIPMTASTRPGSRSGFARTSAKFSENDNYERACIDEFGPRARAADWREVKDLFRRHPSMQDFIIDTGLDTRPESALILNSGEKWGPRHTAFIIQMRDHTPSMRGEGVIEDIGNRLFELKIRNDNRKPVLCQVPMGDDNTHEGDRHDGDHHDGDHHDGDHHDGDHHDGDHHDGNDVQTHMTVPPMGVRATEPTPPPPPREPRLLSTARQYREFVHLNDKCKLEFGPDARIADWTDIKRMVNSRRDLERFVETNEMRPGDNERLVYFNGQYKSPRDRHFFVVFNHNGNTPNGVTPIDSIHNHRLDAAAVMHMRARVLCFVP